MQKDKPKDLKNLSHKEKLEFFTKNKKEIMAGYEKMNIGAWTALQKINKCIYGCKKFKEPLYVDKGYGGKILNPIYLAHIKETHGLPPMTFVDMIADMLYKDEKDKQKMREFYKFLEKY